MECINCGKRGHSFRDCTDPITSFGIIALRFPKESKIFKKDDAIISHIESDSKEETKTNPEVLMIMRKDSLGYVEFLRGKYNSIELVTRLVDQMTISERIKLQEKEFDELWFHLWSGQRNKQFTSEYNHAKSVFENIKTTGIDGKKLDEIISECTTVYEEPEWGFPKGRRSINESEFSAALREFREETGWGSFKRPPYCLRDIPTIVEKYTGSNGIDYRQIYYIGICDEGCDVSIDIHNKVQTREVGNIGWFSFSEATKKIRDTNIEKKKIIVQLNERMDEIIEAYKDAIKSKTTTGYYGKRKTIAYSY
jgi:8-oxo-dGTP pyrophosphatase MutT (NUDIX family)